MPSHRTRPAALLAAILLTVLAACSSDDSTSETGSDAPGTVPTTAPVEPSEGEEAMCVAIFDTPFPLDEASLAHMEQTRAEAPEEWQDEIGIIEGAMEAWIEQDLDISQNTSLFDLVDAEEAEPLQRLLDVCMNLDTTNIFAEGEDVTIDEDTGLLLGPDGMPLPNQVSVDGIVIGPDGEVLEGDLDLDSFGNDSP